MLPYWTDPHQNLSLDVRESTNRLRYDLLPVRPEQVSVSGDRIAVSLPVHVDAVTTGRIRLTRAKTHEVEVDAVLTPVPGGCVLEAALTRLPAGRYRIAVGLGRSDRAPTDLRLTLIVGERGAREVRAAEDTSPAARPVPWALRKYLIRLLRPARRP